MSLLVRYYQYNRKPEQNAQESLATDNRKTIVELKSGKEFPSISSAARHFNLRREAVRDVVNGKRSHTAGLVFIQKMT